MVTIEQDIKICRLFNCRSDNDSNKWKFEPKGKLLVNGEITPYEIGNVTYNSRYIIILCAVKIGEWVFTLETNIIQVQCDIPKTYLCAFRRDCHYSYGELEHKVEDPALELIKFIADEVYELLDLNKVLENISWIKN